MTLVPYVLVQSFAFKMKAGTEASFLDINSRFSLKGPITVLVLNPLSFFPKVETRTLQGKLVQGTACSGNRNPACKFNSRAGQEQASATGVL